MAFYYVYPEVSKHCKQLRQEKFSEVTRELLIFRSLNDKIVSLIGWDFDISYCIHVDAMSGDVKSGGISSKQMAAVDTYDP
jgi:hypothetical protein